jgi:uncharacterized protein with HEPN domain
LSDDAPFLHHVLDAIREIEDFTSAGRSDFESRRIVQAAVTRNLEVIGEAVKRLSVPLREANPDVPWSQIAGMRDVLITPTTGWTSTQRGTWSICTCLPSSVVS